MSRPNTKEGATILQTVSDVTQNEISLVTAAKPLTIGGFRWKIRFVGSNELEHFTRLRWGIQIVKEGHNAALGQFPTYGEPFDDGLANVISWGTGYMYAAQRNLTSILHPDAVSFVITGWYQDLIEGTTNTKRKLQKGNQLMLTCIANNGNVLMDADVQWVEWY